MNCISTHLGLPLVKLVQALPDIIQLVKFLLPVHLARATLFESLFVLLADAFSIEAGAL